MDLIVMKLMIAGQVELPMNTVAAMNPVSELQEANEMPVEIEVKVANENMESLDGHVLNLFKNTTCLDMETAIETEIQEKACNPNVTITAMTCGDEDLWSGSSVTMNATEKIGDVCQDQVDGNKITISVRVTIPKVTKIMVGNSELETVLSSKYAALKARTLVTKLKKKLEESDKKLKLAKASCIKKGYFEKTNDLIEANYEKVADICDLTTDETGNDVLNIIIEESYPITAGDMEFHYTKAEFTKLKLFDLHEKIKEKLGKGNQKLTATCNEGKIITWGSDLGSHKHGDTLVSEFCARQPNEFMTNGLDITIGEMIYIKTLSKVNDVDSLNRLEYNVKSGETIGDILANVQRGKFFIESTNWFFPPDEDHNNAKEKLKKHFSGLNGKSVTLSNVKDKEQALESSSKFEELNITGHTLYLNVKKAESEIAVVVKQILWGGNMKGHGDAIDVKEITGKTKVGVAKELIRKQIAASADCFDKMAAWGGMAAFAETNFMSMKCLSKNNVSHEIAHSDADAIIKDVCQDDKSEILISVLFQPDEIYVLYVQTPVSLSNGIFGERVFLEFADIKDGSDGTVKGIYDRVVDVIADCLDDKVEDENKKIRAKKGYSKSEMSKAEIKQACAMLGEFRGGETFLYLKHDGKDIDRSSDTKSLTSYGIKNKNTLILEYTGKKYAAKKNEAKKMLTRRVSTKRVESKRKNQKKILPNNVQSIKSGQIEVAASAKKVIAPSSNNKQMGKQDESQDLVTYKFTYQTFAPENSDVLSTGDKRDSIDLSVNAKFKELKNAVKKKTSFTFYDSLTKAGDYIFYCKNNDVIKEIKDDLSSFKDCENGHIILVAKKVRIYIDTGVVNTGVDNIELKLDDVEGSNTIEIILERVKKMIHPEEDSLAGKMTIMRTKSWTVETKSKTELRKQFDVANWGVVGLKEAGAKVFLSKNVALKDLISSNKSTLTLDLKTEGQGTNVKPADAQDPSKSAQASQQKGPSSKNGQPNGKAADKVEADQLKADQLKAAEAQRQAQLRQQADQLKADQLKADQLKADQLKADQLKADQLKAAEAQQQAQLQQQRKKPRGDPVKKTDTPEDNGYGFFLAVITVFGILLFIQDPYEPESDASSYTSDSGSDDE